MNDVAFIPYLKSVIAACLAKFEDYTDEVELYKDAVVANAGGIIPLVTFEYHTGMDAVRHGCRVLDSFVFDGIPYGFTSAGLVRLTDNVAIPFTGQRGLTSLYTTPNTYNGIGRYQQIGNVLRRMQLHTITEVESGTGAIITTNVVSTFQDFNGVQGQLTASQTLSYASLITDGSLIETPILDTENSFNIYPAFTYTQAQMIKIGSLCIPLAYFPNLNVQYLDPGWMVSIYNSMAFFDEDWVMTRYIKLDEPYFYSQIETFLPLDSGAHYTWNTTEIDMAKRNGTSPSLSTSRPSGKSYYHSPYAYMVHDDRTVIYHVD